MRGIVKFFKPNKGYGFIRVEGRGDIFFNHASILGDDQKMLETGDIVTFNVGYRREQFHAVNVVCIKTKQQIDAETDTTEGREPRQPFMRAKKDTAKPTTVPATLILEPTRPLQTPPLSVATTSTKPAVREEVDATFRHQILTEDLDRTDYPAGKRSKNRTRP